MQASTWIKRFGRLGAVLAFAGLWFAAGQFLTYHMVDENSFSNEQRCSPVTTHKSFDNADDANEYAFSHFEYEDDVRLIENTDETFTLTATVTPASCNWLTSTAANWDTRIFGYFFGLLATVLSVLIMFGLGVLARWIWRGPSEYVDPCQDDNCPCARHEEERRDAESAHTMMIAAAAGAVGGFIAGS